MITQIKLTNFKCFRGENTFALSSFNLLTGINGKGKSTLLQSLLLMKQTVEYNQYSNNIILNGSCVQLGSFEDIKNSFAGSNEVIKFEFTFSRFPGYTFEENLSYTFKPDEKDDYVALITEHQEAQIINYDDEEEAEKTRVIEVILAGNFFYTVSVFEGHGHKNLKHQFNFSSPFQGLKLERDLREKGTYGHGQGENYTFYTFKFISADRIGPQNFYGRQNAHFNEVGTRGENTASVLYLKRESSVSDKLYLGANANTLLQQVEEWLNYIFEGAKINIKSESSVILISYNTKTGSERRYKPANVGFGYSYILPIVVAGLIATPGHILIIENPEAHLHPSAQHRLTRFLAKIASTGVQIFVESHSEHILNALRICTIEHENSEKILNNTDVSILYFQDKDEQSCVQIPIDNKGGIDEWPNGFFDQTDKDFKILFGF